MSENRRTMLLRSLAAGAGIFGAPAMLAASGQTAQAASPPWERQALKAGGQLLHAPGAAVNVHRHGARGNGKADDTAAIQRALDAAGKQGGNVVALPRGNYLIKSTLHVPPNATLQGVFRAPTARTQNHGSCLLAVGGKGKPDGKPFISLEENGTLYGLTIFHPEQTCPSPPVEYPWTVRQLGDNGSLVNVLLVNPWQGVDFGTVTGGRHYIHGLYGQPLKTGLFIDKCEDVGRVENVHFWPFWQISQQLQAFTSSQGTAFRIGRTDWEYMLNCFCISYRVGYHFIRSKAGAPNVLLTQCGSDVGPLSVLVDASQEHAGISFVNGQFMAGVRSGVGNTGPLKFTNCGFWGTAQTDSHAILEGAGHTTFVGCHFTSWARKNKTAPAILARKGGLTINACEFLDAGKKQVTVEASTAAAIITANRFHGAMRISNAIGKRAVIGMNSAG